MIEYLITGGSGSLGKTLTKHLLKKKDTKGIRIYSRGETLQWEMKNELQREFGKDTPVSFLIGDIRDRKRIEMAAKGVGIIIHAAALKHVPVGETNPLEMIKTNIIGSSNVLEAALTNNVKKLMAISTDKACLPVNLYGGTKFCSEKLFINGNTYSAGRMPYISVCRYGNVLGSRGSIVPLFKKQFAKTGKITTTHKDMTRFWITLDNAVEFILGAIDDMEGGEMFIPMMSSAKVLDIAKAIVPDAEIIDIGIRPGEKLHEILISKQESLKSYLDIFKNRYVISDKFSICKNVNQKSFEYRSDNNKNWLAQKQIKEMIGE